MYTYIEGERDREIDIYIYIYIVSAKSSAPQRVVEDDEKGDGISRLVVSVLSGRSRGNAGTGATTFRVHRMMWDKCVTRGLGWVWVAI